MKKRKRLIVSVICMLMCLSLMAACGSGGDSKTQGTEGGKTGSNEPSQQGSVKLPDDPYAPPPDGVQFADHIEALFPADELAVINVHNAAGNSPTAITAYRMFMDTLVFQDYPSNEILPYLAKSWESVDSTEFTFHLRDDVYFHNGEKFTADDVCFTIYASQTWGKGGASYDAWQHVEKYEAIDDYTVYLKLKSKNVEFLNRVSSSTCGIVNRKAVTEDEVKGYMIGTGAYKITDFSSMDHVTFERSDNYWGEKPITKTQTWRIVPEANTRMVMLQNGQTDAIFTTISEGDIEKLKTDPDKFSVISNPPGGGPNTILFNMTDPICGDYNFRRACVHAINREEVALITQGPYGYLPVTDGTLWGYYMPYRNTDIPFIEYDPQKAKEYLAKSVYKGEEITILTAMFSVNYIKAAEVIQQQLNEVGIKTKIVQTDNAGFQAATQPEVRSKNQILVWTQTLTGSLTSAYRPSFYTNAVRNRQSFSNAELDELIDRDDVTEHGPEKEAICKRMQEIVGESLCTVNLFWSKGNQACVRELGGIRFYLVPTDYRYIYKVIR